MVQQRNEGALYSNEFRSYLIDAGIPHKHVPTDKHNFNGVVERCIQSLRTMSRCALLQRSVPFRLWFYAVRHAVFVKNRLPHETLQGDTPFRLFRNREPDYKEFIVFGCLAYKLTPFDKRKNKFLPVTSPGVFVGFDEEATHGTVAIYSPESKRISHAYQQDVTFRENVDYQSYRRSFPVTGMDMGFTKHQQPYLMEDSDDDSTAGDTAVATGSNEEVEDEDSAVAPPQPAPEAPVEVLFTPTPSPSGDIQPSVCLLHACLVLDELLSRPNTSPNMICLSQLLPVLNRRSRNCARKLQDRSRS